MPYKSKEQKKLTDRRYYEGHKEEFITKNAQYRRTLRKLSISAYGGRCVCCGETEYEFLSFDHINNNGADDRRNHYANRASWFNKLLREHPTDIQILCHNCNCAKGYYGICPHERKRQEDIMKEIGD